MRTYWPMLAAADQLAQFEGYLSTDGLQQRNEAKGRFNLHVKSFVREALKEGLETDDLIQAVHDDIDAFVNENGGTEDFSTATIREAVIARIRIDAARPPWLRTSLRWAPAAVGVALLIAYFSVRFTSAIDVAAPLNSRAGIELRAQAVSKVIFYDESMSQLSLRGGWLKEIFYWPVQPTEEEIAGAAEFVDLTLSAYDFLAQQRSICPTIPQNEEQNLSAEQVEFVNEVAEAVVRPGLVWKDRPVDTILAVVAEKFHC